MTPEIAYFLKVNLAIALFYAFYRLFFYKDTFFRLRRSLLLAFFGVAFLYPLLNIQEWMQEQEPIAEVITLYSSMFLEVPVEIPQSTSTDWQQIFLSILLYGYFTGIVALGIRFCIQFGSILILSIKCKKTEIKGAKVYVLNKSAGPFSFFNMIFVCPGNHTEKEMEEILTHEKTHARQYHSIDVIICEVLSIICWFNPFVWLLKREVRHNLEYLADNMVIQSGYDSKSYQYHLLGLAHHQGTTDLYNSFNVIHLKNRISMMNKKRSRGIVRTKYLAFIPLASLLMLVSNIEAVARVTKTFAKEIIEEKEIKVSARLVDLKDQPIVGGNVLVRGTTIGAITDKDGKFSLNCPADAIIVFSYLDCETKEIQAKNIVKDAVIKFDDQQWGKKTEKMTYSPTKYDKVYTEVDVKPTYPGGEQALMRFFSKNIKYPVQAQMEEAKGRVVCSFVVDPKGKVTNLQVMQKAHPLLDKEALRVLSLLGDWTPGMKDGKPVPVLFIMPVVFGLQKDGKFDNGGAEKTPANDNEVIVVGYGPSKS